MPPIESSGTKGMKVPQHPVRVGLESGENLECGSSLKYSHTASVEGAATQLSRRSHQLDRKSTRLNSSHSQISYAVFCLKKKKKKHNLTRIHLYARQRKSSTSALD